MPMFAQTKLLPKKDARIQLHYLSSTNHTFDPATFPWANRLMITSLAHTLKIIVGAVFLDSGEVVRAARRVLIALGPRGD